MGTGTSHGVPIPGCFCSVCRSSDPRNRRGRSSLLISSGEHRILIDAATEFRLQAVRSRLSRLDALLITHTHADHVHGIDDIRAFSRRAPIPVYASRRDRAALRRNFSYIFSPPGAGGGIPRIILRPVQNPFSAAGLTFTPVPVFHGPLPIYGFRFGNTAYLTDCSAVPPAGLARLENLDTLILGALRHTPSPTHYSIPEALNLIKRLRPRRSYFTHLSHSVDHARLQAELPPGIRPAYDGLKITVSS